MRALTSWYDPIVRLAVIGVFVIACADKPPAPPEPQKFQTMTATEKCEATAPRATRCSDELMLADAKDIDSALGNDLERHMGDKHASQREAAEMRRIRCVGSDSYPAAVLACWTTEPCQAFAECVTRAESKARR